MAPVASNAGTSWREASQTGPSSCTGPFLVASTVQAARPRPLNHSKAPVSRSRGFRADRALLNDITVIAIESLQFFFFFFGTLNG